MHSRKATNDPVGPHSFRFSGARLPRPLKRMPLTDSCKKPLGQISKIPEAPPFDCGNFEKRATECSAELTASYATTASAERLRGKTPEE